MRSLGSMDAGSSPVVPTSKLKDLGAFLSPFLFYNILPPLLSPPYKNELIKVGAGGGR